jgi:hypothetical protein
VSFPHTSMPSDEGGHRKTVALSPDADVIMFVNLCNNIRGKSKNKLINPHKS